MAATAPATKAARSKAVKAKAAKYVEVFKVTLLSRLAYIYDVLFRQVFLVVIMYVFVQLWRTTYSWEGATDIAGFTIGQMIWYLTLTESMMMAMPPVGRTIDEEVKSGSLAYSLSRPYSYALFHYAGYMGEAAFRFVLNFLIAGMVAWLCVGPPVFTIQSVIAGLVSAFMGFAMDFSVQFGIGLAAFWVEDTWSFRFLYTRLVMILGGMMIPLDVFPEAVRRIAAALPTSLIVYGPVRTFLSFSLGDWVTLLAKQVVWFLILILAVTQAYRTGVKRVNVQGG